MPEKVTNDVDKHFSLLGLTAANCEPVMCCIVFAGIIHHPQIETSIDFIKSMLGDTSDPRLFENNFGDEKAFPLGPTCTRREKEVPCFIRWREKGDVTSSMLAGVLREMDARGAFDRLNGITYFIFLDVHRIRAALEFVEYANEPLHKWTACIGVPCGTSLWQTSDYSE